MKVLVIGATGYLGSHIAGHLVEAGHEVVGTARKATGNAALIAKGVQPVAGDLADLAGLAMLMVDVDAVVYAAQLLLEPEHQAVRALLQALEGSGKTFIFTSGTGVLSQKTDGAWSEDSFAEDDLFTPSKWLSLRVQTEKLVREAANTAGVRTMVIRPPMIWGNGGSPLIRHFYESAARTGSVCYIGRGLNLYSNVHVEDLAEVYRLALERGSAGALYHAVAGETRYHTVAQAVARELSCGTRSIGFVEAAQIWDKFLALIIFSTCSRSRSPRTRRELGWTPVHHDLLDDVPHPAYRTAY